MDLLVIPDGNRRWASAKLGKTVEDFSKQDFDFAYGQLPIGINRVIDTIVEEGGDKLYFWCNSVTNLTKRTDEVVRSYLSNYLDVLKHSSTPERIRIHLRGNLRMFEEQGYCEFYDKFQELQMQTQGNRGFDLFYFLNYSTQDDLKRAVKTSQEGFSSADITALMDEPENIDIVLRTGGHNRLSGFSLVRSPSAEIYVVPEFFPDISQDRIKQVITRYNNLEINNGA